MQMPDNLPALVGAFLSGGALTKGLDALSRYLRGRQKRLLTEHEHVTTSYRKLVDTLMAQVDEIQQRLDNQDRVFQERLKRTMEDNARLAEEVRQLKAGKGAEHETS